jgi:hypothetical protein
MPEKSVISAGLKLNDLVEFEVGVGVILLTVKDAGKNAREITYSDLYEAVQRCLAKRLERYNVGNPEQIVEALLAYLRDYQSVFTMEAQ